MLCVIVAWVFHYRMSTAYVDGHFEGLKVPVHSYLYGLIGRKCIFERKPIQSDSIMGISGIQIDCSEKHLNKSILYIFHRRSVSRFIFRFVIPGLITP